MARVKVNLGGLTKSGTYSAQIEALECMKGRDLVWTFRVTDGDATGQRIVMVTPVNQPAQLWLLRKALVNLGELEPGQNGIELEWGDDGHVTDPMLIGRNVIVRITQRPKGPRIEVIAGGKA